MSIELCVLGSGSSGNATLLRLGGNAMLIDAGFGPRAVAKRLAGTGVSVADLGAILLTHLDTDHFNPSWFRTLLERRIPLHLPERHVYSLYESLRGYGVDPRQLHKAGLIHSFDGQPFTLSTRDAEELARVRPIYCAHDAMGTAGYVIEAGGRRLGYATDLGRVNKELLTAMRDVDVLAIESNYDPEMELNSSRPAILKRRIMGGRGHLSNEQALEAVRHVFERSTRRPKHVVLLHLSRQCNCPKLVRRMYETHAHIASRLCISSQHQRTEWLRLSPVVRPNVGEQLAIFG